MKIVAVDCMKAGADDYILKDNLSRLGTAIINSIKKAGLAKEKNQLKKNLEKVNKTSKSTINSSYW